MNDAYVLTLSCANHSGIVAAVTSIIARHGGDITEAHQFDDETTGLFFMRSAFKFVDLLQRKAHVRLAATRKMTLIRLAGSGLARLGPRPK